MKLCHHTERLSALLFIAGALALCPFVAHAANFLGDTWGVVTDPLKLGRASATLADNVQRTLGELHDLETKTNVDVSDRVTQIHLIVSEIIESVNQNSSELQALVQSSIQRVQDIENKTAQDAIDLIYRGQCAAEVAVTDQLQRGLSDTISNIIKADPTVRIFGIRILDLQLKTVQIVDPDQAYSSTKAYYLGRIKDIKPGDNAYQILSTYQNIARFARFARCHYIDLGLARLFVEEQAEFERRSSPWLNDVSPQL